MSSQSLIPNDVQAAIKAAASQTPETANEVPFDRNFLCTILADFSSRLYNTFRQQITLVIHGGAVMILHPTLASSTTRRVTRDVDFIKRAFVLEMKNMGVPDGEARLQACIDATAGYFRLGTDWMNAHADVALPMALTYVLPSSFPSIPNLSSHNHPSMSVLTDRTYPQHSKCTVRSFVR